MKFFFTLILFGFLTSCSTTRKEPVVVMDEAYLNCEAILSKFIDIFECIKSDDSTKNLKTDEVDLLFLKGEQLEEKINEGQLSSVDAKFEWIATELNRLSDWLSRFRLKEFMARVRQVHGDSVRTVELRCPPTCWRFRTSCARSPGLKPQARDQGGVPVRNE